MKHVKNAAMLILIVLSIVMLSFGIINKMLPPALTGVGFGVIAILFLSHSKDR